jgi:hypothetical protein
MSKIYDDDEDEDGACRSLYESHYHSDCQLFYHRFHMTRLFDLPFPPSPSFRPLAKILK